MGRRTRRRLFLGCVLPACLVALAICGVAAVLLWAEPSTDALARVKALPVYPGATSVQIEAKETAQGHTGVLSFDTPAGVDDMFAFYDSALKQAGWQPVIGESDGGTAMYTQHEGSFEGIELSGASGGQGGGFPWVSIKRNQSPLWVHIDVSYVNHNTQKWTHVSVELTQP